MSFSAAIHHEGYVVFHEVDPIDYTLLADETTRDKLRKLLSEETKFPIQDPELLKRCKNSRRFHYDTKGQAIRSGLAQGLASGLTYGLSDVIHKKSFPRLKEKHLPEIRKMMLQAVVDCGLTPQVVAVLDEYVGDNDLDGIPDLVPEYQFWRIYIKAQNPKLDFAKKQKYEEIRHQEKKVLLAVQKDTINMINPATIGGVVKTFKARKSKNLHEQEASELEQKRLQLEAELEKTVISTRDDDEYATQFVSEDGTPSVGEDDVYVPPTFKASANSTKSSDNPAAKISATTPPKKKVSTTTPVQQVTVSSQQSVSSAVTVEVTSSTMKERQQRKREITEYGKQFKKFGSRVSKLVAVLKKDHKAYTERLATRQAVTQTLCLWMEKTPLESSPNQKCSSVLTNLDKASSNYGQKYQKALHMAMQWEVCVLGDLNQALKQGKTACTSLGHYERKVDSVREQLSRSSGKRSGSETVLNLRQKLQRNETKLVEAQRMHQSSHDRLKRCQVVVDHAWVAFCPLLQQILGAELEDVEERGAAMSSLSDIFETMTTVVRSKGVSMDKDSETVWKQLSENGPSNWVVPATTATTVRQTKEPSAKVVAVTPKKHVLSERKSDLPSHLLRIRQQQQHQQQQQTDGRKPDKKPTLPPHLLLMKQQQRPGLDPDAIETAQGFEQGRKTAEDILSDIQETNEEVVEEETTYDRPVDLEDLCDGEEQVVAESNNSVGEDNELDGMADETPFIGSRDPPEDPPDCDDFLRLVDEEEPELAPLVVESDPSDNQGCVLLCYNDEPELNPRVVGNNTACIEDALIADRLRACYHHHDEPVPETMAVFSAGKPETSGDDSGFANIAEAPVEAPEGGPPTLDEFEIPETTAAGEDFAVPDCSGFDEFGGGGADYSGFDEFGGGGEDCLEGGGDLEGGGGLLGGLLGGVLSTGE